MKPVETSIYDDLKISENFRVGEFYVSKSYPSVAAKIPRKVGDIISLTRLCNLIIQPIRDFLGKAVTIGSGVRSDELNRLVDGSKTSQHVYAEAADLEIQGDDTWKVFHFARKSLKNRIGQCIIYLDENMNPRFLHVSTRSLRGSTKAQGEFLVKLSNNPRYFTFGIEPIPGSEKFPS